jgi:Family of unknown function (DUF6194)
MLAWFAGGAFQANQNAGAHHRRYGQPECGRWKDPGMTADEILHLVTRMPGAVAVTASEANHAPEPAWGDTFFFYAPEGDAPGNRRFPFATIVIKVYAGFDTASNLNRPGVFRLNIAVGRDKFKELIGYSPARSHWTSSRLRLRRPEPAAPAPGLRIAILGLHPEPGCGEQRAPASRCPTLIPEPAHATSGGHDPLQAEVRGCLGSAETRRARCDALAPRPRACSPTSNASCASVITSPKPLRGLAQRTAQ